MPSTPAATSRPFNDDPKERHAEQIIWATLDSLAVLRPTPFDPLIQVETFSNSFSKLRPDVGGEFDVRTGHPFVRTSLVLLDENMPRASASIDQELVKVINHEQRHVANQGVALRTGGTSALVTFFASHLGTSTAELLTARPFRPQLRLPTDHDAVEALADGRIREELVQILDEMLPDHGLGGKFINLDESLAFIHGTQATGRLRHSSRRNPFVHALDAWDVEEYGDLERARQRDVEPLANLLLMQEHPEHGRVLMPKKGWQKFVATRLLHTSPTIEWNEFADPRRDNALDRAEELLQPFAELASVPGIKELAAYRYRSLEGGNFDPSNKDEAAVTAVLSSARTGRIQELPTLLARVNKIAGKHFLGEPTRDLTPMNGPSISTHAARTVETSPAGTVSRSRHRDASDTRPSSSDDPRNATPRAVVRPVHGERRDAGYKPADWRNGFAGPGDEVRPQQPERHQRRLRGPELME